MYRPLLANTLQAIADDPFTFYNGSLAENITLDIKEAGNVTFISKISLNLCVNTFIEQNCQFRSKLKKDGAVR